MGGEEGESFPTVGQRREDKNILQLGSNILDKYKRGDPKRKL